MAKRRRKARKVQARRYSRRRRLHGLGQMDLGESGMEMPMMAGLGQFDYRQEGMSTGMKLLIGAAVVGAGYYFFMRKSGSRKIDLALSAPGLTTAASGAVDTVTVTPSLKVDGVVKSDAKFKLKDAVSRPGVLVTKNGQTFVISKVAAVAATPEAAAVVGYSAGDDLEFVIVEDTSEAGVTPAEQKVSVKLGQMNWDTQTLMGLGSMAQYNYAGGGGGIYTAPRGGADYYGGRGYTYGTQNPFAAG
jgi:hypothetical protein